MMPVIAFLPPKSADGPPGVFSDNGLEKGSLPQPSSSDFCAGASRPRSGGKKGSFSGAACSAHATDNNIVRDIVIRITRFMIAHLGVKPAAPLAPHLSPLPSGER